MAITAQMVKALRESTGAGMMDCKNALTEAGENLTDEKEIMELAVEVLRKKGMAKAAKRLDRETSEGLVVSRNENGRVVMFSITCETDFVSRNDDFQAFAAELMNHVWATNADSLDALLNSSMNGKLLSDVLAEKTGSIGEKIDIRHYVNKTSNGLMEVYIHSNNKVGTLVELVDNTDNAEVIQFAKDVAMHIAAMKPIALDRNGVDKSVIEKELDIIKDQLRNEGKPEDMLDKISSGKLNRFYKDNTLNEQAFVKSEDGATVEKSAKTISETTGVNATIASYERFEIGG